MDYEIIDDKGVIETFDSLEEALESVNRVRDENDVVGDLKIVQVHFREA